MNTKYLSETSSFDQAIEFVEAHFNDDEQLRERLKTIVDASEIVAFLGLIKIKRAHREINLASYLEAKREQARKRLFSIP